MTSYQDMEASLALQVMIYGGDMTMNTALGISAELIQKYGTIDKALEEIRAGNIDIKGMLK